MIFHRLWINFDLCIFIENKFKNISAFDDVHWKYFSVLSFYIYEILYDVIYHNHII